MVGVVGFLCLGLERSDALVFLSEWLRGDWMGMRMKNKKKKDVGFHVAFILGFSVVAKKKEASFNGSYFHVFDTTRRSPWTMVNKAEARSTQTSLYRLPSSHENTVGNTRPLAHVAFVYVYVLLFWPAFPFSFSSAINLSFAILPG